MKIEISGELLKNKEQTIFLNSNINFIFGKNGAGKTYVLRQIIEGINTKINNVNLINNEKKINYDEGFHNWSHYDSIPMFHTEALDIFYFESNDFENILINVLNPSKQSFLEYHLKDFLYEPFAENEIKILKKIVELETEINKIIKKYLPFLQLKIVPNKMVLEDKNKKPIEKFISLKLSISSSTNLNVISSGERKIVSMIIYMFKIPTKNSLVIMDEPFIHLHSSLVKDVLGFLNWISKEHKLTFLISTHNINVLQHWKWHLSIGIKKSTDNEIEIINSYNNQTLEKSILKTIPEIVADFSFNETINSFFSNDIILVEGVSDKFYLDSLLDGQQQVIAAKGKDEIIKSLYQIAWHCKNLKILCDGDVDKKLIQKINNHANNLQQIFNFNFSFKTTDDFCDFKNSDIERIFLGVDGHKMTDDEKSKKAFNFLIEKKQIKNQIFIKWIIGKLQST